MWHGLGPVVGVCLFFWTIEEVDDCWLPHPCGGEPLHHHPQHTAGVTTECTGDILGMSLQFIEYYLSPNPPTDVIHWSTTYPPHRSVSGFIHCVMVDPLFRYVNILLSLQLTLTTLLLLV